MESPLINSKEKNKTRSPTNNFFSSCKLNNNNEFSNEFSNNYFSNNNSSNFKFYSNTNSSQEKKPFSYISFLSNKKQRSNSNSDNKQFNKTKSNKKSIKNSSYKSKRNTRNMTKYSSTVTFLTNNNKIIKKNNASSIKKNLIYQYDEPSIFNIINNSNENNDLEAMIDYIVNSTKNYKRQYFYNINDENNKNTVNIKNNGEGEKCNKILFNVPKKGNDMKEGRCTCKKTGCGKYSCNCLKNGIKCGKFCSCLQCVNK